MTDDAHNNVTERVIGRPFKKGQSGNPGGRPKQYVEAQKLLDAGVPEAARMMIDLMRHEDPKVAVMATKDILDRTLGKAKESVEVKTQGNALLAELLAEIAAARRSKRDDDDNDDEP